MAKATFNLGNVPNDTRQPKVDLGEENYKLIFEGQSWKNIRQVNEKILIGGLNGSGKTSLALNVALYNIKDDEIVIYLERDNSGAQIIKNLFSDYVESGQLRPINPIKVVTDEEGKTVIDKEATVDNVTSIAASIQKGIDNGFKVKAVIIDGLSFLLKDCEAVMRIDKKKAVDEGIPMGAWKVRADKFNSFYDPYMTLPTSVIFLGHEDFVREMAEDGKFANVKQLFIDECSMRMITEVRDNDNPDVTDYYVIIKKHRAKVTEVNKEYKFFSVNNKTKKSKSTIEDLANVIFSTKVEEKNDK
jgi:hypothetical protein